MNLGTFLMSAALAMATAPNAFAVPVFYDDRAPLKPQLVAGYNLKVSKLLDQFK